MSSNMERYTTSSLPGPSTAKVVTNPAPRPIAASNGGRSIGKAHKSPKEALKRSYISPSLKTPFEKRKEKEKAQEAVKAVEQEMKEDEEAKRLRKRTHIKERRDRQEERLRMEQMAAKMSAKKLQRLQKRQGRSKKING